MQQANLTGKLDQAEVAWMIFTLEKEEGTILEFSQRTVRLLQRQ